MAPWHPSQPKQVCGLRCSELQNLRPAVQKCHSDLTSTQPRCRCGYHYLTTCVTGKRCIHSLPTAECIVPATNTLCTSRNALSTTTMYLDAETSQAPSNCKGSAQWRCLAIEYKRDLNPYAAPSPMPCTGRRDIPACRDEGVAVPLRRKHRAGAAGLLLRLLRRQQPGREQVQHGSHPGTKLQPEFLQCHILWEAWPA